MSAIMMIHQSNNIPRIIAGGGGGGGGSPNLFTVGDGKTVSITTIDYYGQVSVSIVTNGEQSALVDWFGVIQHAYLDGTGGPFRVNLDSYATPVNNGNGTWTYIIMFMSFPDLQSWTSFNITDTIL